MALRISDFSNGLAVAVFLHSYMVAVALPLGKGLAMWLQAELLGAISTAFLFILSVSGSACLMWRCGLCGCKDRKCALSESVRSEQSRARAKAVALWWEREWLSACEICG